MTTDSALGSPDLCQVVFATMDDGVIVLDPNSGSVIEVNPAMLRMFDYSRSEALGLAVERLCLDFKPFSPADALAWAHRALNGEPQRFEWRTRNKRGRAFRVEVQLERIILGGTVRLLAIIRDSNTPATSERCSTGQSVPGSDLAGLRRQAGIGILAGGIAHGLNNSLTPILGYASEARSMATDPAMAYCLDETLKACGKARNLVASLLALSRRNDSKREAMYLWPALEGSLHAVRALLPPGISLDVQGDASHIMVVANPGDVHELVLSLCTVASQSLPEKRGALAVRFEPGPAASGSRVSVRAAATGGEPVKVPNAGGIFTSVRDLTESLGGSLALSPRTNGLEVSVLLPGATGPAQTKSASSRSGHILFIDDDEAITRLVCKQLSSAGFLVTAVSDSDEGLRRFSHAPMEFDCVVTDLLMPGLSGQTLAQRIRELRPDVPVLLCSGNCELSDLAATVPHCFAGFIPKPFSKRELTQAVSTALARSTTAPAG